MITFGTPRPVIGDVDGATITLYSHNADTGDWKFQVALYAGTVQVSREQCYVRRGVDDNGTSKDNVGLLVLDQDATTIRDRVRVENAQVDDAYASFNTAMSGLGHPDDLILQAAISAGVFPAAVNASVA